MSVKKYGPWELDLDDLQRFQDVLPKDEAVQIMFTGWGKPANKSYLEICAQSIPKLFTMGKRLKNTLTRSKKRNRFISASEERHQKALDKVTKTAKNAPTGQNGTENEK